MKRIAAVFLIMLLLCGCTAPKSGTPITCTLEIRCDTVLDRMDDLKEGKESLIPENGVLLETVTVTCTEGDSVFDVLRSEIMARKLHFDFTGTSNPYVRGICNLYEFDCGEGSGWIYSVNGTVPSVGCGTYRIADGDVIVFAYTCDYGNDLGGEGLE